MGIKFYNNISDGGSHYNCESCGVYLTNKKEIMSTNFTGVTGQAYLFKRVVNIKVGKCCQREMMSGSHYVRDVFCLKCEKKIGWMYELAIPESERYKEGAVTLEKKLIKKMENPFEENTPRTRAQYIIPSAENIAESFNERLFSGASIFPHSLLNRSSVSVGERHFGPFEPLTSQASNRFRIAPRRVEENPRNSEDNSFFGETSDLFTRFHAPRRLDAANMPVDFQEEMQAAMNELAPHIVENDNPTTRWAADRDRRLRRRREEASEHSSSDNTTRRRRIRELERELEVLDEGFDPRGIQDELRVRREIEAMHAQMLREQRAATSSVEQNAGDSGTAEEGGGDW